MAGKPSAAVAAAVAFRNLRRDGCFDLLLIVVPMILIEPSWFNFPQELKP
jgi:hypothetical protein